MLLLSVIHLGHEAQYLVARAAGRLQGAAGVGRTSPDRVKAADDGPVYGIFAVALCCVEDVYGWRWWGRVGCEEPQKTAVQWRSVTTID